MDSVKMRFLNKILKEAGERMLRLQGNVIARQELYETGNLTSGRHYSVSGNSLTWVHAIYERFLDMSRLVQRSDGEGTRKRKGRRIHNRFVHGHFTEIIKRTSNEFTDDVVRSLQESWGDSDSEIDI